MENSLIFAFSPKTLCNYFLRSAGSTQFKAAMCRWYPNGGDNTHIDRDNIEISKISADGFYDFSPVIVSEHGSFTLFHSVRTPRLWNKVCKSAFYGNRRWGTAALSSSYHLSLCTAEDPAGCSAGFSAFVLCYYVIRHLPMFLYLTRFLLTPKFFIGRHMIVRHVSCDPRYIH